ncbi:MAG: GntR family transcriptional regulator [Burkholderiales bacterium]|nr:GntR family transcriptional regulator [Burkholderiales bacterium]
MKRSVRVKLVVGANGGGAAAAAKAHGDTAASSAPSDAGRGKPSAGEREDISRELRRRIAAHDLPPGSQLKELKLAAEFVVPRLRVREALARLEQRGLVERIPNKGAIVTRLSLDELVSIYQAREVLEGLCVRLAAERAPDGSWDELLALFEGRMWQLLRDGDFDSYFAGYEEFRSRMLSHADNVIVCDMLGSIIERTQMIIRRVIMLPGRAEQGLTQHIAVLHALRERRGEDAERIRRETLCDALGYVRRYHKFLV